MSRYYGQLQPTEEAYCHECGEYYPDSYMTDTAHAYMCLDCSSLYENELEDDLDGWDDETLEMLGALTNGICANGICTDGICSNGISQEYNTTTIATAQEL